MRFCDAVALLSIIAIVFLLMHEYILHHYFFKVSDVRFDKLLRCIRAGYGVRCVYWLSHEELIVVLIIVAIACILL